LDRTARSISAIRKTTACASWCVLFSEIERRTSPSFVMAVLGPAIHGCV
jgi:hypothetical protein